MTHSTVTMNADIQIGPILARHGEEVCPARRMELIKMAFENECIETGLTTGQDAMLDHWDDEGNWTYCIPVQLISLEKLP